MTDFKHRELKCVGKRVFRLGLAANYGVEEAAVERALKSLGTDYLDVFQLLP